MNGQSAHQRRETPLPVRVSCLMGGCFSQVGWMLLAFGLLMVIGFRPDSTVRALVAFSGDFETTTGTITGSEESGGSVNDTPVYRNHFEYSVGGTAYQGVSYATGDARSEGDRVSVEYLPESPSVSRIQGMRASMFGAASLVVGILPALGLALILFSFRANRKLLDLVRRGVIEEGRYRRKEPTNVRVNRRRVYNYIFEFTPPDGFARQVSVASARSGQYHTDSKVRLLYDPRDPSKAEAVDSFPGGLQLDELGRVRASPRWYRLLILPGIVAAQLYFIIF